jgi:hypothetical protein
MVLSLAIPLTFPRRDSLERCPVLPPGRGGGKAGAGALQPLPGARGGIEPQAT